MPSNKKERILFDLYSFYTTFAKNKKINMELIADSGSTKTDWLVVDGSGKEVKRVRTQGLNPFHLSPDNISNILRNELLGQLEGLAINKVRFFGTGCTPEQIPPMRSLLLKELNCYDVLVGSDLLGAAYALCGSEEGIACILGTGANSCLYNGKEIVANTPPLGYILGDEGSGAVLGKLFLNGIFKGSLNNELRDLFLKETNQTYADIINKVYREPLANRYLAGIAKFIGKHKEDCPELKTLVIQNFCDFITKNVDAYGRHDLPLGFVGSIAWYFQDELKAATAKCGYRLGKVLQSPLG